MPGTVRAFFWRKKFPRGALGRPLVLPRPCETTRVSFKCSCIRHFQYDWDNSGDSTVALNWTDIIEKILLPARGYVARVLQTSLRRSPRRRQVYCHVSSNYHNLD